MPEITLAGVNALTFPHLATWGWQIALYLFLGGLVAGMMILSAVLRLTAPGRLARARLVSDLAGFPLLSLGMLCLLLDLSSPTNVWRFYTTFQVSSAMSWGAWILLLTMIVLALQFVSRLPTPGPRRILGLTLFARLGEPPPANAEEAKETSVRPPSPLVRLSESVWARLSAIGAWGRQHDRPLAVAGLVLGIGVGFYTGVLLSTVPARPLWNTAVLAPLFLASGLGTGGAFVCLFLDKDEHRRIVPFSFLTCAVEIVLLLAYALNLSFGNSSAQRAGTILLSGSFGLAFWVLVLSIGLVLPAVVEQLELMHRRVPGIPMGLPPLLKLTGGLALRFVIVYAGLLSVV